jgi:hypothetical protein
MIIPSKVLGQNSAYRHRNYEGRFSETKAPFAFYQLPMRYALVLAGRL